MDVRKQWLQFSLPTFLAMVTAFCVWLGWHLQQLHEQRRSVAAIKQDGGRVYYDYQLREMAPNPRWLFDAIGDDFFSPVLSVKLPADVSDADLASVSCLRSLQWLSIRRTSTSPSAEVTDAGLAHLAGLSQLRYLDLRNTRMTEAGLIHLHGLASLQELYLPDSVELANNGDEIVERLPTLQVIGIGDRVLYDSRHPY
ncbi:MAG: hypothetical protein HY000_03600 [Planctomycetes bacterium]|nr:hypothetical protein [Planctomycetota bacterium]